MRKKSYDINTDVCITILFKFCVSRCYQLFIEEITPYRQYVRFKPGSAQFTGILLHLTSRTVHSILTYPVGFSSHGEIRLLLGAVENQLIT